MIVFLTSSPCIKKVPEDLGVPCLLNEANEFVVHLKENWKPDSKCLIISADPDFYERNDEIASSFGAVFPYHGMTLSEINVCDSRNEQDVQKLTAESDVIILSGGHVPTQNQFFQRIGLKDLLKDYPGIIIGVSAGTMNSADIVYAQPELEGESIDPDYQRFIPGLDLTDVMILPHYQETKYDVIDGKRLFEDITYPDSIGRKFYALIDGSYVLIKDGKTELYGEGYLVQDGSLSQISEAGGKIDLQ